MPNNRFKKNQTIVTDGKKYKCFVCDGEFAVFAHCCIKNVSGTFEKSLNLKDTFTLSNVEGLEDGFEFELVHFNYS